MIRGFFLNIILPSESRIDVLVLNVADGSKVSRYRHICFLLVGEGRLGGSLYAEIVRSGGISFHFARMPVHRRYYLGHSLAARISLDVGRTATKFSDLQLRIDLNRSGGRAGLEWIRIGSRAGRCRELANYLNYLWQAISIEPSK